MAYLINMLGRSCCGKRNSSKPIILVYHHWVNIYLYIGHYFGNEHHFELKNNKNEFIDL